MFSELTNEELMTIDGGFSWKWFGVAALGVVATIAATAACVGATLLSSPVIATGFGICALVAGVTTTVCFIEAFTN